MNIRRLTLLFAAGLLVVGSSACTTQEKEQAKCAEQEISLGAGDPIGEGLYKRSKLRRRFLESPREEQDRIREKCNIPKLPGGSVSAVNSVLVAFFGSEDALDTYLDTASDESLWSLITRLMLTTNNDSQAAHETVEY